MCIYRTYMEGCAITLTILKRRKSYSYTNRKLFSMIVISNGKLIKKYEVCNAGNKVATHLLNSMPYKIKHIIVVSSIDCKTLNAFLCLYGKLWIDQTMLTDYLYSFSYFIVYHLPYDPYDTLSEWYFVFYLSFFYRRTSIP